MDENTSIHGPQTAEALPLTPEGHGRKGPGAVKKGRSHYAPWVFVVNAALFGTYYAVSKGALRRIDAVVFASWQVLVLLPLAGAVLFLVRHDVTRDVIKRGIRPGVGLLAVVMFLTMALEATSATATAFFPCLNGILSAFIARAYLGQPVRKMTWVAAVVALIGMVVMVTSSPLSLREWRGMLIALLGAALFTVYIFLFEKDVVSYQTRRATGFWPILSVQFLTMGCGAAVLLLLFGNWQAVHPVFPADLLAVLWIGLMGGCVPVLLSASMQKYVTAVTVNFIYILEPILGALIAYLYLHERFPAGMYQGLATIVLAVAIQTTLDVNWSSLLTLPRSSRLVSRHGAIFLRMGVTAGLTQMRGCLSLSSLLYILFGLLGGGVMLLAFTLPALRALAAFQPHLTALWSSSGNRGQLVWLGVWLGVKVASPLLWVVIVVLLSCLWSTWKELVAVNAPTDDTQVLLDDADQASSSTIPTQGARIPRSRHTQRRTPS